MVAAASVGEAFTVQDVPEPETLPSEGRRDSGPLVPSARYEVGDAIGRGGMGEVVVAHDVQIGRDVAIKRLHHDRPSAPMLSRFMREARIQGRLEHPSIPPVYELAHDESDRPFFAMRKLEGITLSQMLREARPRFSPQRLLRAFVDVCNAIELAHSRRVIHCDLKPSNILLGEHGEVYVIDWGIARELDAPPPPTALGTPGYMAPEQMRNKPIDGRADVYALGCVLYEIVTGKPLHPRGTAAIDSTLRGVEISDAALPPELADLCRRATQRMRSDRIASARELGDGVQSYLDGDRDTARRRELACQHLEAARAALAAGDDDVHRSTAMREAGQALALDPALPGAAELVGGIMLEPPRKMPAEVVRDVAASEEQESVVVERISLGSGLTYLAALPLFIAFGITDVPYLTAYGMLSLVLVVLTFIPLVRKRVLPLWTDVVVICAYVVMNGLLARMFTPFIVAPGAGAVALMTCAYDPRSRSRLLAIFMTAGMLGAVLLVYLAEVVGLVSPTTISYGSFTVLRPPVEGIENFPSMPAVCAFVTVLMIIASFSSQFVMRRARRARNQLHLHAWHLRQLIKR